MARPASRVEYRHRPAPTRANRRGRREAVLLARRQLAEGDQPQPA